MSKQVIKPEPKNGVVKDEFVTIPIEKISVIKEIYPRIKEDPDAIARYRDAIDNLPPITVARGRILVDGYHRVQAYKLEGRTTIKVIDLGDLTDVEIFEEAIRCNSAHGQQLSQKDKAAVVRTLGPRLIHLGGERKKHLSDLLQVSESSIDRYSKEVRQTEEEQQKSDAKAMWLDCYTQEQIAEKIGVVQKTVSDWVSSFTQLTEFTNPPESRQHFDVWEFTMPKEEKTEYFGAMPPQVVENLLWLYTQPGDIVFDPFAGSGTTINVAKRMGRPIWASDRKPYTELLPIHQHDIVAKGYPTEAPKQNVKFILLDPPYWIQAKDQYSKDPEDMGNMSLEKFMSAWDSVAAACAKKLNADGYIAFIVSPAEVKDNNAVVDLAHLMYNSCEKAGLVPVRRIIVKYGTQQATGQQVTWARDNKKLLKLYRDLVVFRKGK